MTPEQLADSAQPQGLSAVETTQMSAVETEESAAETEQMSADDTRQMSIVTYCCHRPALSQQQTSVLS